MKLTVHQFPVRAIQQLFQLSVASAVAGRGGGGQSAALPASCPQAMHTTTCTTSDTMFRVVVVLLSTASLSMAQDNCVCVPYFYCTNAWNITGNPITWKDEDATGDSTKCNCKCDHYDVCCDLSPGLPTSKNPNPQIDVCGMRGKAKPTNKVQAENPFNISTISWKDGEADEEDDPITSFGEFPWMVAVMNVISGYQAYLCGGAIISPYIILTTAHKLKDLTPSQLSVKAGVWDTSDMNETGKHQDRLVASIVLHSAYDEVRNFNDFALLFLQEPLTVTDNIATICLPSTDTPIDRFDCIATGWKAIISGNSNTYTTLRKVSLELLEVETCLTKLQSKLDPGFYFHNSFICVVNYYVDICEKMVDGGAPLMCPMVEDPHRFVLVGIASWRVGCAIGLPMVYSSVEAVADWIETQVDAYYDSLHGK